MFSLRKTDPFFTALLAIAEHVQEAIHYANDFKINNLVDLKEISTKLKRYEREGDDLVYELTTKLNTSFITPIERDDILRLSIKMDDILDGIEHFTAHLEMFSLTDIDEYVHSFMENIVKSTDEIVQAMLLLSKRRLVEMREHAITIKKLESICDDIYRTSIKQLFITEKDPIRIIQYKDIYEQLEDVADYCEDVATTIEAIIMRNA